MNSITAPSQGQPGRIDSVADAVYRKVAWRLIPLLFLCYIAAYLDRVNVAFAKLQMLQALNLSEAVYGLGASIFFIGYFIFEIPSNMMLHRVVAGRWIARIMVSWAVLSAAMMFVNSATSFYIVRFLLGVAEAGFFPGIILYLTYWFPAARRGRATSLFLAAVAVAARESVGSGVAEAYARLEERHEMLRARVQETVGRLDVLIGHEGQR